MPPKFPAKAYYTWKGETHLPEEWLRKRSVFRDGRLFVDGSEASVADQYILDQDDVLWVSNSGLR